MLCTTVWSGVQSPTKTTVHYLTETAFAGGTWPVPIPPSHQLSWDFESSVLPNQHGWGALTK